MRAFAVPKKMFIHKLGYYLKEYVKVSNIHGLHYLGDKRPKIEKLFWAFVLLLSLAGCGVMIYKIWEKYENNPIVLSFAPKAVPLHEISFPAVTICPETKCVQAKFNYTDALHKILNKTAISEAELRKFYYVDLLCEHFIDYSVPQPENKLMENDFFDIMEMVKPEFKVSCLFMSKNCKCEQLLFPIITDQGICYSFNIMDKRTIFRDNVVFIKDYHHVRSEPNESNKKCIFVKYPELNEYPFKAFLPGAENSLQIAFSYEPSETDYMCNSFLQGYRVLVHNPLDIPRLQKHYFRVPHDKAVMVAVEPSLIKTSDQVQTFDVKKRSCYLASDRQLKFFKVYSQSNCIFECLTNYTLEKCGCVKFYMPRMDGTQLCGTRSDDCVETAEDQLRAEELRSQRSASNSPLCDCQPACVELSYNVDISQSDFYHALLDWSEEIDVKDEEKVVSFSLMNIYFKKEQFMAMERKELYGVSDLISNFGGLLGLFTGFSLISLFEIIYFLTLRLFNNNQIYNDWSGSMR